MGRSGTRVSKSSNSFSNASDEKSSGIVEHFELTPKEEISRRIDKV